jgi:hypothetical protein
MRRRRWASFDEASLLILAILEDGEWHKSTAEIHEPLRDRVSDPMFGRVKKHYDIEHRQVGGGPGSYFEWRRSSGGLQKQPAETVDAGLHAVAGDRFRLCPVKSGASSPDFTARWVAFERLKRSLVTGAHRAELDGILSLECV